MCSHRGYLGSDHGVIGLYRTAATGAGLSNVLNNLPAYTASEAVVPTGNSDQLLALLIGTNVGPIVTPWASLATLLCLESCRDHDLWVPLRAFVLTGLGLAVAALAVSVGALLLTR
jgi:arsenical pump membrane protein